MDEVEKKSKKSKERFKKSKKLHNRLVLNYRFLRRRHCIETTLTLLRRRPKNLASSQSRNRNIWGEVTQNLQKKSL